MSKTNVKIQRALITGVTGSGGSYLADYIVENHPEVEVHGIGRWHSTSSGGNLSGIRSRVTVHECDLTDFSSILTTLEKAKPDVIFHLAAHANVRASFQTPLAVMNNNIMGTANLFEAVRLANINPIFLVCSTSEVYGQVAPKDVPIREETPLFPASPYAVSKIAQDLLGYTYFVAYKMPVIRTRMFAYLNPRRTDLFATSFALQVARIEVGLQKELLHGNLDSVRTIIDVRDAMRAYWDAALHCTPGEAYNIGGKTTMTVGQFLDMLKTLAKTPIPSRVDPALLRPADVTLQIPAIDKFEKETGWKPRYSFEESVQFLLDHCRRAAAAESHGSRNK
ncbi:MAG TPA: GDP-mannose 4,6-dehydratase [Verrucomicrobiae bacterium]|jgi:GDPmannose 4,6-dehydratase/GDP-4-dehydro-6-deoxy-D-mannose reductase